MEEADTELNLVPIMNLFTALIPFLLLSAAFIQVKVINASVPVIDDGSDVADPAADERPVVVNVQITPAGYEVSAAGDLLSEKELAAYKRAFRKNRGGYDKAGLAKHLSAIKSRHPKSDTVIIVPDKKIRYEEIISVMDTARERSGSRQADGKKNYLFPKVVVATLH